MSEIENTENTDDLPVEDELTVLKQRADQMGISYHPNIGLDKLREKLEKAMAPKEPESTETPKTTRAKVDPNLELKKEAIKLVRVRITCMNPAKREWEGEIFTCGNAVVPSQRRMVPFNVEWHVPQMLLTMIEERMCQVFHTVTDEKGRKVRRGKLIKEFAVEKLEALTEEELHDLAQRQAMAAGTASA